MIREVRATIMETKPIARAVHEMILRADTSALCNPGQFVNIRIPGLYLRRPISVCTYREGEMTLIY
ncbi:MAG: dihydroorotate dehydrogenase electron transfer subunit, partial [Clostridia bacterium]|nr:dihydroorotate dehydrogenase electron transfer subunit [Clostridia bacterium]